MERAEPVLRVATPEDASRVDALMKKSTAVIFPRYYDEQQVASSILHVAAVDRMLLEDGTYFVLESDGEPVACGGWSRRDRLFTGTDTAGDARPLDPAREPARVRAMFVHPAWARRGLGRAILDRCEADARAAGFGAVELMATLPGEPLYAACGYTVVERCDLHLPDGVTIGAAKMSKALAAP